MSVDSKFLADQEMSVISTYLNDNAQTPLNGFVAYMLYKQVCNKHGEKLNRWSLSPSVCAATPSTVGRAILNSRYRVQWRFCSNSTAVHTNNGSREQNHAPFKGDLSSLWTDLI